jgi:putative peptide zinc metalloprotease protein
LLASSHGGEIQVRERKGLLVPEKAIYRVVLAVTEPPAAAAVGRVQRGQVVIYGSPKTLLGDFLRAALAVLVRESGW